MRTAEECLAKAAEMVEQAERCPLPLRDNVLEAAEGWRRLATMAEWQDRFKLRDDHEPKAGYDSAWGRH